MGLLEDISKETGKYRRDFEQIVENQPCIIYYTCMPLLRIKEKEINERGHQKTTL